MAGSTEELVGDVGGYRGAACGDAVLHHEDEEFGEELIDLAGGPEVVELDQEVDGEVDVHGLQWLEFQCRMAKAEAGAECGKATLAAASGEMTALLVASGDGRCAGGTGCFGFILFLFGGYGCRAVGKDGRCSGVHPRGDRKSAETSDSTRVAAAPLRKRVCK